MTGKDGDFRVTATDRSSKIHDYRTKKVIVSTGYYDLPNELGIPGEDLEKVHHYYKEPYPYYDSDVLVIGGKNSAAEALSRPVETRRARDPGVPWRSSFSQREVLGEAGPRESHQEW